MGSNMPFTGKGSNTRPLDVSREQRDKNYEGIFGKRMSWLDRKKVIASWQVTQSSQ